MDNKTLEQEIMSVAGRIGSFDAILDHCGYSRMGL
jgi:hypothetical protein